MRGSVVATSRFVVTSIVVGSEGRIDFSVIELHSYIGPDPVTINGWFQPDTNEGMIFVPNALLVWASA